MKIPLESNIIRVEAHDRSLLCLGRVKYFAYLLDVLPQWEEVVKLREAVKLGWGRGSDI